MDLRMFSVLLLKELCKARALLQTSSEGQKFKIVEL